MREITATDDQFHFAQMGDRWWMTETAWFSFCVPERKLGGWLYTMVRPNIGTVAGGAWVWDDSATLPWEVPYSSNLTAMPLQDDADLNDATFRNGVSIKTIDPLSSYALGYQDEGLIKVDLRFDAVMPPRPLRKPGSAFGDLTHFDQFGRVHGTLALHGEEIAVDCLAMRDRSWGPRPEHRPRKSAYVSGIASPEDCFLFVTKANELSDQLAYGFMIKDGKIGDLVEGTRHVERDLETGFVQSIQLDGVDEHGRKFEAHGKRLSGITLIRHSFIDHNGLMEWTINGKTGHGEDQDMWPVHDWSRYRREAGKTG